MTNGIVFSGVNSLSMRYLRQWGRRKVTVMRQRLKLLMLVLWFLEPMWILSRLNIKGKWQRTLDTIYIFIPEEVLKYKQVRLQIRFKVSEDIAQVHGLLYPHQSSSTGGAGTRERTGSHGGHPLRSRLPQGKARWSRMRYISRRQGGG